MVMFTQISGTIKHEAAAITALTEKLKTLDIRVYPQLSGEFITKDTTVWELYNDELKFYRSIAKSNFHIVCNDGEITDNLALQIAYAMLRDRPILMTNAPKFSKNLQPQLHDLIAKNLRRFHAINLLELEFAELSFLIRKLKASTNYKLTDDEKSMIRSLLRDRFYELVDRGIKEVHSPFAGLE